MVHTWGCGTAWGAALLGISVAFTGMTLAGCGATPAHRDGHDGGAVRADAGSLPDDGGTASTDAGPGTHDAGLRLDDADASPTDAGAPPDDAGSPRDAAMAADAGFTVDAGPPEGPPPPRFGHIAEYVGNTRRMVVFGGASRITGTVLDDTWIWDATTRHWSRAAVSPSPSARYYHACAYDTARQEVVMFGGHSDPSESYATSTEVPTANAETWSWDGSTWRLRTMAGATAPEPRVGHKLAYDVARGRTVLFGGSFGGATHADTWLWDGTTWTKPTPAHSPPARAHHAMAYDARRNQVVLFGGWSGAATLGDTWTWDGSDWTQITVAPAPPARSSAVMAFDGESVVLLGGWASFTSGVVHTETWSWNGSVWTLRTPATSPRGRYLFSLAHDPVPNELTLFDGWNQYEPLPPSELWQWNRETWTRLGP